MKLWHDTLIQGVILLHNLDELNLVWVLQKALSATKELM
jgi:hypothetical protein